MPATSTPSNGKGGSFQSYGSQVELRCQAASLQSCKRASDLVLQMDSFARDVCLAIAGLGENLSTAPSEIFRAWRHGLGVPGRGPVIAFFLKPPRPGRVLGQD